MLGFYFQILWQIKTTTKSNRKLRFNFSELGYLMVVCDKSTITYIRIRSASSLIILFLDGKGTFWKIFDKICYSGRDICRWSSLVFGLSTQSNNLNDLLKQYFWLFIFFFKCRNKFFLVMECDQIDAIANWCMSWAITMIGIEISDNWRMSWGKKIKQQQQRS